MKSINFLDSLVGKHYSQYDEDRKRNVSILLILDLMMVVIMACWSIIFWYLKMPEMFWLDTVLLFGFFTSFVGLATHSIRLESARFITLFSGALITGVPPIYYGIDTIVTAHLAFLALATILMFSRKERDIFIKYFYGILGVFLIVIIWNFTIGPIIIVEEKTFKIFNSIVGFDIFFIASYFTYFFFKENNDFKDLLAIEREKSDQLLLSIFPETIANKLKISNKSVADTFDHVTILFADIVGFTEYSSKMSANELVGMLDEVFSEFDALVDKYGIEKIKTIGDAYMAVGGLPIPDPNHCHNVVDLALEIVGIIKEKFSDSYKIKLRIGIHTGKAVAGVIGNKKFSYDLWGDSVNIASRFESSGMPEKINVSQEVRDLLGDDYLFEDRGKIEVKGKGMMQSFFLLGKKSNND